MSSSLSSSVSVCPSCLSLSPVCFPHLQQGYKQCLSFHLKPSNLLHCLFLFPLHLVLDFLLLYNLLSFHLVLGLLFPNHIPNILIFFWVIYCVQPIFLANLSILLPCSPFLNISSIHALSLSILSSLPSCSSYHSLKSCLHLSFWGQILRALKSPDEAFSAGSIFCPVHDAITLFTILVFLMRHIVSLLTLSKQHA